MSTTTKTPTTAEAPFEFLPLGAIIRTFKVGNTNIVQNFPTQALYTTHNSPYFGETIGRIANRIAKGRIDSLDGKSWELARNNGENSLHGGVVGWGKRVWEGPVKVGERKLEIEGLVGGGAGEVKWEDGVRFSLRSEDGDEGYPGTVQASVIYTIGRQEMGDGTVGNLLDMEYQVELVGGAEETVVNVTNHSYFNISGKSTIEGTQVELCTNSYLPVDNGGIPTGGPQPYAGVEAHKVFTLGPAEPDIDDCFIVNGNSSSIPLDTRSEPLTTLVKAYHPSTGIHLEVLSTEPAFQFYTGKYIDVPAVDGVPARTARSGFCVEPSRYVNAPNIEEWKGQVLLRKGEVYGSRILYRGFSH